jgi:hypothetical protein
LSNDCTEFAQSLQALVFDDFVRIYFSTRNRDMHGMYLSHISFVDMDKTAKKVLNISAGTVIELGGLGCILPEGLFLLLIRKGMLYF